MKAYPIYRPEIRSWSLDRDGQWSSAYGWRTSTLFVPMPDEDGSEVRENGFRREVRNGTVPDCVVLAPDESELLQRGTAWFLYVSPKLVACDAFSARVLAGRREHGLALDSPAIQSDGPAPRPPRGGLVVTFGPAPASPPGPAHQLSLFDDAPPEPAHVPR